MTEPVPASDPDPSIGQLATELTQQSSRLIREELQLARLELEETVAHAGKGVGAFGAAGVLAWFGVGTLIATAVIALDLALPLWLSALIVTVLLFAISAVAASLGKREISQTSPVPERAVENMKKDVDQVKEAAHHAREQ